MVRPGGHVQRANGGLGGRLGDQQTVAAVERAPDDHVGQMRLGLQLGGHGDRVAREHGVLLGTRGALA